MFASKSDKGKNDYQGYLEKKHAEFNTPSTVIDKVVSAATRSKIRDTQKVVLGEVNEVYDITTENNQQVVVRISRSEAPRFAVEKWAIDEVRKVGVPVPEVLLITSELVGNKNLAFCVETKLPGIPLRKIPWQERDRIIDIIHQAGAVLAKIHSVTTRGFGEFKEEGVGRYPRWADYMTEVAKKRESIITSALKIGLTAGDVDKGLEILRAHRSLFEGVTPHLLHSDFSSKHILVQGNTITGILDFEGSRSGDPMWDFAWWNYFFGTDLPVDWLKQGYAQVTKLDPEFDKKINLYRLRLGLSMIHYYESEDNISGMKHVKENFLTDLKNFS